MYPVCSSSLARQEKTAFSVFSVPPFVPLLFFRIKSHLTQSSIDPPRSSIYTTTYSFREKNKKSYFKSTRFPPNPGRIPSKFPPALFVSYSICLLKKNISLDLPLLQNVSLCLHYAAGIPVSACPALLSRGIVLKTASAE